jgi:hypothetical protein
MAQNDTKSTPVVTSPPVADNESTKDLFVKAYLTIHKTYAHSGQWNYFSITNENGDTQSISLEKFLHMGEQVMEGKKFVQTIQTPYRGIYQGKESNKPDIKIMGNVHFEKGYVLLEVLQSKDGSTAIASASDVHKRSYFKIKEDVLFAYLEVFANEMSANKRLAKLALARSVNLSECLSL